MVLADSSVVTIALPEILDRYATGVPAVAWVLIAYNLALALAAVPAAHLARARPTVIGATGLAVFSASSLTCALAPSFALLIASRVVQAVGGALVLGAALALLIDRFGNADAATTAWIRAGIAGATLGPAVGGLLTQLLGWESIFFVQVPVSLLALASVKKITPMAATQTDTRARPAGWANIAVALVAGALTAALFLLVILLINGWRLPAAGAGAVLTVMPISAILVARFVPPGTSAAAQGLPGAILICGGLAGLALLPQTGWWWTIAPQILVGAGLGLTVEALTEVALAQRGNRVIQAGWSIGARHVGVVVGLALLTPIFSSDLVREQDAALVAGTAAVLDSRISPVDKLKVAQDVLVEIDRAKERVPDLRPTINRAGSGTEYRRLADDVQVQLDRAATHAFSRSFWIAAGIGVLALLPILALSRRRPT